MGKRLKVMTKQGKKGGPPRPRPCQCFTQVFKHLRLQPFLIQVAGLQE